MPPTVCEAHLFGCLSGALAALIVVEATDSQITEILGRWVALVKKHAFDSRQAECWCIEAYKVAMLTMSRDPTPEVQRAFQRIRNVIDPGL